MKKVAGGGGNIEGGESTLSGGGYGRFRCVLNQIHPARREKKKTKIEDLEKKTVKRDKIKERRGRTPGRPGNKQKGQTQEKPRLGNPLN